MSRMRHIATAWDSTREYGEKQARDHALCETWKTNESQMSGTPGRNHCMLARKVAENLSFIDFTEKKTGTALSSLGSTFGC